MAARMKEIQEQNAEEEAERFLKTCSRDAYLFFSGAIELTQSGFERCLEEMVAGGFNRLYRAFGLMHSDMMEQFDRRAEEIEKKSRQNVLPDEIKEKLWKKIQKRLKDKNI